MPDFPVPSILPLMISTFSRFSAGYQNRTVEGLGVPAAKTWVANLAVYIPFMLPFSYPVARVFWANGSTIASSNADVGIYNADGVQLYHTGSTALSGTTTLQFVSLGTPMLLSPGTYYMAYACDNTTNRAHGTAVTAAGGRCMGLLQQSTAFALPATATFASWDATGFYELMGITRTTTGM